MAGILDGKQRLLDTIITQEGRRQVAAGDLRIMYASFTDRHTFYKGGADGAAEGADERIYFEAANRPQDQIIFEVDQDGRMLPFTGGEIEISGNKLMAPGAATATSPLGKRLVNLTGSQVPEAANNLLKSSAQNFRNQYILGTNDVFSETSGFTIKPDSYTFKITDGRPLRTRSRKSSGNLLKYRKRKGYAGRGKYAIDKASINDVEALYEDMRLSHLPNFQYLPPVNKKQPGAAVGSLLGNYEKLNQASVLTLSSLMNALRGKEFVEIEFTDTSPQNTIIAQMLDIRPDGVEKLTVIDYGSFVDNDPTSPGRRVFFLGRLYYDDNDSPTFVNIFTIIFD